MVTQRCKHRQCCWIDIYKWLKRPDNYCALRVCRLSRSSHVRLFCDAMGCSSPAPPVPGILQARTLERLATTFSRGSSRTGDRARVPYVSCTGRRVLHHCSQLGSPTALSVWPQLTERERDGATLRASGPAQRHWQTTASRTPARGAWAVTTEVQLLWRGHRREPQWTIPAEPSRPAIPVTVPGMSGSVWDPPG